MQPGVGDTVEVLSGPYAGKSGVITAKSAHDAYDVFIDDCCRPTLAASAMRRTRRRRSRGADIDQAVHQGKLSDAIGEEGRLIIDSRDLGDGL